MAPRRWRARFRRLIPLRLLPSWLLLGKGERSELFREHGWARSLQRLVPLDQDDQPMPWIPYAAVDFLAERLAPDLTVLELGAGYSTLFFMTRVARVVAVEHDPEWVHWVRERAAANVMVDHADASSAQAYLASVRARPDRFDLVFVDGEHRVEAFAEGLDRLTARGVILLDDSRRAAYAPAFDAAARAGLRHLHFEGHKAASVNLYRTTVFYRDGNCLGI